MAAFKINEVSCSSSLSSDYTYDVFLSFRGEDARFNFVGHLYKALTQRGIETFLDDKSLQRGKSISPEIEKSIRKSRFAVVVFSQNYAKSSWYMEELVEIIRCMEAKSITVLPIFHGVNPSDVCNQTGTFALYSKSFKEDERDQVPIWKSVLTKAGNLSGWDDRNRDEASVIEEVVMHVLTQLSRISSNVASGLVGMESRMKQMKSLLEVGLNDVRMIGICGMGGIGKTTLAEQIYRNVSSKFDGCCFLEHVQEAMKNPDGHNLQKQLLSAVLGLKPWDNMKRIDIAMRSKCVLIVLDDVEDLRHLEGLAGKHDWFGSGSRIIITSQNKQLLEAHGVDTIYKVEILSDLDSLKLFKQYAFRASNETDELAALSQQVVNYAKGLPLAVKILGSSLAKRTIQEWKDELEKLRVYPPEEVLSVLQLSFNGLDPSQRKIFLDIACFLNGDHVDRVINFLESCNLFPVAGLSSLQGKCLITIIDNKIGMHDLLQEMGRKIVLKESEDPGKHSRLWYHKDVNTVLAENKGTDKIEGMVLNLCKLNGVSFKFEALSRMTKLRLLKVYYFHLPAVYEYPFSQDLYLRINPSDRIDSFDIPPFPDVLKNTFVPPILHNLRLFGDWITLSNELRCLHWDGYPLKYLPSNFYPQNLVELDMSNSCITKCWAKEKQFYRLKIINLCNSKELTETPDFTGVPSIEILVLKGCTSLKEIHPSVGLLKKLLLLNLEDCKSLQKFPNAVDMKSLEVFLLSGCVKFELFPNIQGYMQKLAVLNVDGTAIKELPVSIRLLTGLQVLSARSCKCLTCIPISITELKALRILDVSGCSSLKRLPENLGLLENLEELRLDETGVTMPPTSIGFLRKLQLLSFYGCPFHGYPPHEEFPPVPLFSWLRTPLSLGPLIFLNLSSLTSLDLSYCNLSSASIPKTISALSSLRSLNLSGNFFEDLPYNFYFLHNLEVLYLAHCPNLHILPALPSSIYYVDASNCDALLKVEFPAGVNGLCMRSFNFMNCKLLCQNVEFVEDHVQKITMQSFAEFSIIIPGNGILMWSEHENRGLSATMNLPGDWYNGTFKGLVLWVVFEVREPLFSYVQKTPQNHTLDFNLKCNKKSLITDNGFLISKDTYVVSDHVWLRYFSSPTFKMTLFDEGWSEIEVFLTTNEQGLVVKKCGLYPLCWNERKRSLIYIHPHFGESATTMPSSGRGRN